MTISLCLKLVQVQVQVVLKDLKAILEPQVPLELLEPQVPPALLVNPSTQEVVYLRQLLEIVAIPTWTIRLAMYIQKIIMAGL